MKKQQEKEFSQAPAEETKEASVAEVNKCEEEVVRIGVDEFSMQTYYQLDNKLIDAYYTKVENFSEDERDLLEAEEFTYFIRSINQHLLYISSQKFVRFWALMTRQKEVMRFLDEFLQNVRKHNDIYQLQFASSAEQSALKQAMSTLLQLVLQLFYRLSLASESPTEYFSAPFYSKLVYDNWLFDMAKLIDIAAIYGKSNRDTTALLIANVFQDKRFVEDFKESVALLIGVIKTKFKEYQKVKAMIHGEYIHSLDALQLQTIISAYLHDYVEVLSNFTLIATLFPESVFEVIRNTNAMIYIANSYCLTLILKKDIIN